MGVFLALLEQTNRLNREEVPECWQSSEEGYKRHKGYCDCEEDDGASDSHGERK